MSSAIRTARHDIVVTTATCAFALLAGCTHEAADTDPLPPSVILISLDTLRYDHCGFNGYERDTTPFLDELAEESIVFDRAYTSMSWTLIAHMTMVTGLYPMQHGVMDDDVALSDHVPTLAERMRRTGYSTVGVHTCGWLDPRFGFGRGFDVYRRTESAAGVSRVLEDTTDWIRRDVPYLLFVHLFDIHSSSFLLDDCRIYNPPAPYDSLFVDDAVARLEGIDAKAWWEGPVEPSPEQHEAVVALYDGGIRYVDDRLRAWFEDWEERGLLDNTIVIITSDHGEGLRQRGDGYGGHGTTYEEGLRVPLLVRLPGGERGGERVSAIAHHVDIVPTLVDLLDLEVDTDLPGRSLVGDPRDDEAWVFGGRGNVRVAISTDSKVISTHSGPHRFMRIDETPVDMEVLERCDDPRAFMDRVGPIFDSAWLAYSKHAQPLGPIAISELDAAAKEDLRGFGYGGEVD